LKFPGRHLYLMAPNATSLEAWLMALRSYVPRSPSLK